MFKVFTFCSIISQLIPTHPDVYHIIKVKGPYGH